ncbi:MAG: septal ring lytic transglycosylase RlpA family protein [Gammaproteobacteria bacterium]|nr:septal ring lytic transglycosylase RlpA family protein [Gammaproteobacteria bacterium]
MSAPTSTVFPRGPRPALGLVLALVTLLAACGVVEEQDRAPSRPPADIMSTPDAVPRPEPRSRYGNPRSYEVLGRRYQVMDGAEGYVERGIASWYGEKFQGRHTSSREIYDMYAMTAAHKSLPLPTYVRVTNLENGRQVVVKVNDRGPFHANRIIDLSYAAAAKLGILRQGTGLVEVRALTGAGRAPSPPLLRQAARDGLALYLQVGAFTERENAARLKTRLHSFSPVPVRVVEALAGSGRVHRVQLGPVQGVTAMDDLAALVSSRGIRDMHVVVE